MNAARVTVTVTGLGAISPLGLTLDETFQGLLAGRSAVRPAGDPIGTLIPGALVASVPTDFAASVPRSDALLDRSTQFALAAARQAIAHAAFDPSAEARRRVGVYVGTGMAGVHSLEPLYQTLYSRKFGLEPGDPTAVHPLSVPKIMPNSAAAWLSIQQGYKGPNFTYSVACASSAVALGEALRAIREGHVDAAVVVGTESFLTVGAFSAWNALRVMARPDPVRDETSCKPFDRRRCGFVLGEGAAAVVLERDDLAIARNAQRLAHLVGYGVSSDASHITLPSREGQVTAIGAAVRDSGLSTSDIRYINAHGTATMAGDVTETESVKQAFGGDAAHLAMSSTKSMHGHLIGAGGALEFAISIKALLTGSLPPTAHLDEPDPQCDLDYVPLVARHAQDIPAVMSNSFAFGGCNVSLVAQRVEG